MTIKISFGGEGATVAVSPATDAAPAPMSIEELHGGAAAASPPRPTDELAGLGTPPFGGAALAPMPIEELLAGSQPGTPTPQAAGVSEAGSPPGPMSIEELGAPAANAAPGPRSPGAPKTTARRSPSTR